MGILLIVASAPSRPPAEPEAAAGEAPACADQPEPEPAEGSRIANAGRGGECLGARKTGVESLGAPSEASRPAWSRGSVGIQRPACGLRDGVVETIARLESIWVLNCPVYFGVSLLSGADFPLFEVGEGGHPGNDRALPTGAACVPVLHYSVW